MELKKNPEVDLEKKSGLFLNIGLCLSLLLVITAFEWRFYDRGSAMDLGNIDDDFEEEPYFTVAVLNTHDNPDEYEPPNNEVEGEVDRLTGIRMKEQSLVLSFEQPNEDTGGGIQPDEGVAIKKSFTLLPNDKKNSFFAYKNLNMYVYGDPSIDGGNWNEDGFSDNVELLFRFGKDDQYY